ncbi:hypothetical protein DSL72_002000 [Monilinia vaccinii-corymbosi]|uniref:Peptidase M48 domain-containing protein n=1 Tax=Monilinia vaccinii-corymbosi TaxID=61207 RepID=A0A8A3PBD9_9HELO|nr:hypothetical protein DSL72_002000 [Monilinia vaccinii-corymbosi]
MFYSHRDMARMQADCEARAAANLGMHRVDFIQYFDTARHVLNEAEKERLIPVFEKLCPPATSNALDERFGGKDPLPLSIHLVEGDSLYCIDHSTWPGRIFITSWVQDHVAVDQVGLATIISHSLAHSYLNHAGETISFEDFERNARYPAPVLALLAIASRQMRIPAALYCMFVGALYVYGKQICSDIHEKEADLWGLELMRDAGYDVTRATKYWERKRNQTLRLIDSAQYERRVEGADANTKKFLDWYIKDQEEDAENSQKHIATIQAYIEDNDILPQPFEGPRRPIEDLSKPTNPENKPDPDVPESQ